MKSIGTVTSFDGLFGEIENNGLKFEFAKKDLCSEEIKEGDIVVFRVEKREPNLLLARYVELKSKEIDIENLVE